MEKEDGPGTGGGPEPEGGDAGDRSSRGPPEGHAGKSHGNRAERTVTLRVNRCGICGRGHLSQLPPVIKLIHDFPDENATRMECVAYVIERAVCKRCVVAAIAIRSFSAKIVIICARIQEFRR